MAIQFTASDQKYQSIDQNENIEWISVTSLIGVLKKPFDKETLLNRVDKILTENK